MTTEQYEVLKEHLQRLSELEIICSDDVRHRTFFLQMRPNVLKVAVSMTVLSPDKSEQVFNIPSQSTERGDRSCNDSTIRLNILRTSSIRQTKSWNGL